jgi:hypothetical protein
MKLITPEQFTVVLPGEGGSNTPPLPPAAQCLIDATSNFGVTSSD